MERYTPLHPLTEAELPDIERVKTDFLAWRARKPPKAAIPDPIKYFVQVVLQGRFPGITKEQIADIEVELNKEFPNFGAPEKKDVIQSFADFVANSKYVKGGRQNLRLTGTYHGSTTLRVLARNNALLAYTSNPTILRNVRSLVSILKDKGFNVAIEN